MYICTSVVFNNVYHVTSTMYICTCVVFNIAHMGSHVYHVTSITYIAHMSVPCDINNVHCWQVMDKVGRKTIEELLPNMHSELKGMSREEAELEFLKEAQKLPEYGMVFYRVARNKSDPIGSVWLGFCVRGIVVYDYHKNIKTPLHYCSWKKTQNLSFSVSRSLSLNSHD